MYSNQHHRITSYLNQISIRQIASQSSRCSHTKYQCLFRRHIAISAHTRPNHSIHSRHASPVHIRSIATAAATSPFAQAIACWKCEAPIIPANALTCVECGCTQLRALEVDHFTLFGIPQSFDISVKMLDASMKRLQKKLHPDKFARENKAVRSISSQLSSHVNSAYEVLKNPLMRANYVLQLHGMSIEEGHMEQSMDVLMLVMDMREQLDEAQEIPDDKQRYEKIRSLLRTCSEHIADHSDQLDVLLREHAFAEIRSLVSQLAYFYRFQEQCMSCLPVS